MPFHKLEYISIENQTNEFPKHFHETFCISLIHKGTEQIDFDKHSLFSEAGIISITNPYEVHSNPLIDKTLCLKFDTIYVPNELMKKALNGKNIKFTNGNRKIKSKKTTRLFLALKDALDATDIETIDSHFHQLAKALEKFSDESTTDYSYIDFKNFANINNYIENHIQEKFHLEELSKMAHINKYGFSKKFKTYTGMTPMNYILMRKVFSSKKIIKNTTNLTDLAYLYNFTDLAHYSKTFKRFIGTSPKDYKNSLL
ncbi:AraC family transcriptional regulator [Cellulophaga baltica]|uniref:AraC family transcriptional regulator n=1 Tax=Cellulophaga TaxID=104264 RepID=UPI001C06637D|nr:MULTISPECIES: AraC family transcriptional regulator [Cellulophaga]MBU2997824.1 AraC family transcriptional regulator [Cellulophaga baltica]MDO6769222.1 AraC family transcriptional regulator [Cellulophaga sp. 1_MG-2023]